MGISRRVVALFATVIYGSVKSGNNGFQNFIIFFFKLWNRLLLHVQRKKQYINRNKDDIDYELDINIYFDNAFEHLV